VRGSADLLARSAQPVQDSPDDGKHDLLAETTPGLEQIAHDGRQQEAIIPRGDLSTSRKIVLGGVMMCTYFLAVRSVLRALLLVGSAEVSSRSI
jgi:hypothetical protein